MAKQLFFVCLAVLICICSVTGQDVECKNARNSRRRCANIVKANTCATSEIAQTKCRLSCGFCTPATSGPTKEPPKTETPGLNPTKPPSVASVCKDSNNWKKRCAKIVTAANCVTETAKKRCKQSCGYCTSTAVPTAGPTAVPTAGPTAGPTTVPTAGPTAGPTAIPTDKPTDKPGVTDTPAPGFPTTEPVSTDLPGTKPPLTDAPTGETPAPTEEPTFTPEPTTAAPVTKAVEDCVDQRNWRKKCLNMVKQGACFANDNAKTKCRKTCGFCVVGAQGRTICEDKTDKCAALASFGHCTLSQSYMAENCRFSCSFC